MATEDDPVALPLPQPPPPAPARREAAIGEALRRFDGDGGAGRAAPVRAAPGRGGFRPWGALVAASLVAVIGLPVAWMSISEQGSPATQLASREAAKVGPADVTEPAAPAAPSPKPPAIAFEPPPPSTAPVATAAIDEPQRRAEPAATPSPAQAKSEAGAPPALAAREAKRDDAARNQIAMADAARAPAAMVAPPPPAPAPAPPPPPMATAPRASRSAEAEAGYGDVVVTSARRRGRAVPDRGDWNACTIDDPRRSLAACKAQVDPAAKGAKGQAAAHLADGLAFAWQGETDRAIAAFDQAIALAPRSALAYLNRGLAYQRQGDEERALADLDRAVRLAPNAARGYYHRSLLLRARGDIRRARADQARAVSLDADYRAVVD